MPTPTSHTPHKKPNTQTNHKNNFHIQTTKQNQHQTKYFIKIAVSHSLLLDLKAYL
jgi:hypothetical protein